jgi:hypothetical protein
MAARWGVSRSARKLGLGAAQGTIVALTAGVLVWVVLGLLVWAVM